MKILDLAVAFPERVETLQEVAAELDLPPKEARMFGRFFGFGAFRCDPSQPLEALAQLATTIVLERNPSLDARLAYVAHCHTLPNISPLSGATSWLLAPFADRGIEVLSVTMNQCATPATVLGAMARLLEAEQIAMILVADKAFHPALRLIEKTTIMGEAAAAILVGHGTGCYDVLGTHTVHETRFWLHSGRPGEPYLDGFDEAYVSLACGTLTGAMRKFGLRIEDLTYVLPHNVNTPSWLQIADRVGLDRRKVLLSTLGNHGHCFGADPFLNLAHAAARGALHQDDLLLLFSVGLGATASCAIVRVL